MSGNPVSIQHQRYARLLSENTLQGTGTHRTSGRQAQTLQAYRTSMREDGAELRLARRACSWPHLDQIRPHGLTFISKEPMYVDDEIFGSAQVPFTFYRIVQGAENGQVVLQTASLDYVVTEQSQEDIPPNGPIDEYGFYSTF